MTFEVITKALEEHGQAVEGLKESFNSKSANLEQRMSELESSKKNIDNLVKKSQRPGLISHGMDSTEDNVASKFSSSEQFEGFTKGNSSTGRVPLQGISIKALTNTGAGVDGSTPFSVQAQRMPGLYNNAQRQLTLLEALPRLPVTSATFEYMQLNGYTNNASFQTQEGELKAEANLPTEVVQAQIATIAHWVKASVQVLADAPALTQQINNLLMYGLLAKLESEIVSGVAGQGKIKGLLEHATEYLPTGPSTAPADMIGEAVVNLDANGWRAGLIVLNPADWFEIVSARATGDGQYVMGSPRDPVPPSLWGVPVVTTPSLAKGSSLILDPAQVAVLDREEPIMLASRNDGANFTSNLITILAEMRAGLAVFAAGAVLVVDFTPPA